MRLPLRCVLESCAGRVNPRGLRVPAFAGRVRGPALLCVRVRVELAVGRGGLNLVRVEKLFVRVEKLFLRVSECSVKAHELNQLKNSQNTWMY